MRADAYITNFVEAIRCTTGTMKSETKKHLFWDTLSSGRRPKRQFQKGVVDSASDILMVRHMRRESQAVVWKDSITTSKVTVSFRSP